MNLLAIVGSPRKGKATDTLVDRAVEGAVLADPDLNVKKIHLYDHNIKFCTNCLTCRDSQTDEPYASCTLRDDMDQIYQDVFDSDVLIFGTPVHMGYATAIMMSFLERICWTFAKPEGKILTITQCPIPRTDKKRKAAIIVTSGIIPPVYRRFCDDATKQIRGVAKDSLNAKTIESLYAGDIEGRGVGNYADKATQLGMKLASV